MTIATFQYDGIGPRVFSPSGPFGPVGSNPTPNFKPGEVVRGDAEAEFVYVYLRVLSAPLVLNQGDVIAWDNAFNAVLVTTAGVTRGMGVGTYFCGGRFGDPAAAQGAPFSTTFTAAGTYGCWVQRSGTTLINAASTAVNANVVGTTATSKQIDAPGTPLTGSKLVVGAYICPVSGTFTANTTAGSNLLASASNTIGLEPGLLVTGTGIPAGTTIIDINASGVIMSNVATATGTGVTVTWSLNLLTANTTSGSTTLTGIAGIAGTYPNQTITGTGIPANTTIVAINGNPGNYTITLSQAATATGTAVTMTLLGYLEAYLRGPCYIDKTN